MFENSLHTALGELEQGDTLKNLGTPKGKYLEIKARSNTQFHEIKTRSNNQYDPAKVNLGHTRNQGKITEICYIIMTSDSFRAFWINSNSQYYSTVSISHDIVVFYPRMGFNGLHLESYLNFDSKKPDEAIKEVILNPLASLKDSKYHDQLRQIKERLKPYKHLLHQHNHHLRKLILCNHELHLSIP